MTRSASDGWKWYERTDIAIGVLSVAITLVNVLVFDIYWQTQKAAQDPRMAAAFPELATSWRKVLVGTVALSIPALVYVSWLLRRRRIRTCSTTPAWRAIDSGMQRVLQRVGQVDDICFAPPTTEAPGHLAYVLAAEAYREAAARTQEVLRSLLWEMKNEDHPDDPAAVKSFRQRASQLAWAIPIARESCPEVLLEDCDCPELANLSAQAEEIYKEIETRIFAPLNDGHIAPARQLLNATDQVQVLLTRVRNLEHDATRLREAQRIHLRGKRDEIRDRVRQDAWKAEVEATTS